MPTYMGSVGMPLPLLMSTEMRIGCGMFGAVGGTTRTCSGVITAAGVAGRTVVAASDFFFGSMVTLHLMKIGKL